MKSIFLQAVFFLITGFAFGQTPTDWKTMGLKGKVKSVTMTQNYRYKKNGVAFTPWEKQYTTIYQFNSSGLYTEFQQLLANGTQNYRIAYSYDLKAKTGERAYYDKENKATIKKVTVFDDKGKLLALIEHSKEGRAGRNYKYLYDVKGNNTKLVYYTETGSVGSETSFVYDDKGNITDMTVETPGYANSYKKYVHDDKGNITEESWYDGKKQMTFRFVRSYDEKGNMIEEKKFKGDNNQLDKTTWKYEYDKKGNWVKKTQYTNDGEDFNIEERTITYY